MFKQLFVLVFIFVLSSACQSQEKLSMLSVSPQIEQTDENTRIIEALQQFLNTKNDNLTQNVYWKQSDFKTFVYPYLALYQIEVSKYGNDFFKPSVMEILPTDNDNQKIVKLAYVGYEENEKKSYIRIIYNLIANTDSDTIQFSSYINRAVKDWEVLEYDTITYYISNKRKANKEQIAMQLEDINMLNQFFNCKPFAINYYSCTDAIELFNLKGFDYNSDMYLSTNGGLAEAGNIVYSANNSELYTHEIVHLYTNNYLVKIPKVIDEGLATYLGGSGFNTYEWHKNVLKKYLKESYKKINYAEIITNPYRREYIDNETPIPYVVGAMLCEYIIKQKGKSYFLESINNLKKKGDIEELLQYWDIDIADIESILLKI